MARKVVTEGLRVVKLQVKMLRWKIQEGRYSGHK